MNDYDDEEINQFDEELLKYERKEERINKRMDIYNLYFERYMKNNNESNIHSKKKTSHNGFCSYCQHFIPQGSIMFDTIQVITYCLPVDSVIWMDEEESYQKSITKLFHLNCFVLKTLLKQ